MIYIEKYDFEYIILWTVSSKDEADEREKFLIRYFGKLYDNSGILANIADGDTGDKTHYSKKDRDFHLSQIFELKCSIREYAKISNINRNTILRWIKNSGLENSHIFANIKKKESKDIRKLFKNSNLSKKEFMKTYNVQYDLLRDRNLKGIS